MAAASNITSGFVDIATYDQLESGLYGGNGHTAYFKRETRKSNWFTIVPMVLSKANGTPGFNQDWAVHVSRAGDYLLNAWLRVTFPAVALTSGQAATYNLRWTKNLMHNLIEECSITFNDLVAARFDNYHLDFWAAFTTPAGKNNGYQNMILNFEEVQTNPGSSIASFVGNLPLPLFFARDSGLALPTAALPYNDIRIQFTFRDWSELLIKDLITGTPGTATSAAVSATDLDGGAPVLGATSVWATYAIVSNAERASMGCEERDILIEQVQTAPIQTFDPANNTSPSYDIRFSHAVKALFFAVRNTTVASAWSNYTSASAYPATDGVSHNPTSGGDPIETMGLMYENTSRLSAMGADFYSLVQPWFHAPVIPAETGYHMYSYSLDFFCVDPMGSTNYGRLTNVSVTPTPSADAIEGANGDGADLASGTHWAQKYRFIVTAQSNNVVRIHGGTLGFPIL